MSPRSGWFRGSPPPVRTDEIPALVKDLISSGAFSDLDDGQPDHVSLYTEQEYPFETGKTTPPWARISVWLRRDTAPMQDSPTGQCLVFFGVQIEVGHDPEQKAGWDYLRAMGDLHDRVFDAINGTTFPAGFRSETIGNTTFRTKVELPVRYLRMTTEAPRRDDKNNTWVQTAEYNTVLVRTEETD